MLIFSIQVQKSTKHSQFSINSLSCIREKYRQNRISPEITEVIMKSSCSPGNQELEINMWYVARFGTIPPWAFFTFFKLYKLYQIAQRTTYSTYQKQWIQFSSERNQDPLHPHLNHVLKFLTLLSDSQCGLQCLKYNSQYAIIFFEIDGIEVAKHPVICRYMKGAYNFAKTQF